MITVSITVSGIVQGVFFRKFTQQTAERLHLNGFVRNNADGSVYIEAQGNAENIEAFKTWCKKGPDAARVETIIIHEITPGNYSGFEIRRTQ